MKIPNKVLFKYFHITRKLLGWFLIVLLVFSGFLRFVELNTDCGELGNYYDFQNTYCNRSGFLNYKIECYIPLGDDINCYCDFILFTFPVVKTISNYNNINYDVDNDNIFNKNEKFIY